MGRGPSHIGRAPAHLTVLAGGQALIEDEERTTIEPEPPHGRRALLASAPNSRTGPVAVETAGLRRVQFLVEHQIIELHLIESDLGPFFKSSRGEHDAAAIGDAAHCYISLARGLGKIDELIEADV